MPVNVVSMRKRLVIAREALMAFVNGYPCGEWEGLLHEEGCPGVYRRKSEREPEFPCRCDGDLMVSAVKQALPRLSDNKQWRRP